MKPAIDTRRLWRTTTASQAVLRCRRGLFVVIRAVVINCADGWLRSVMTADSEMQTSYVEMHTTVAAMSRLVRAVVRCVVATTIAERGPAVPRTIVGSNDSVSAIVPVATGVSVPVVNVTATMTNIPVAAAVAMATAMMEVSSRNVSRRNEKGQGSTSEGNHQKAFHFSDPLGGEAGEHGIGNAGRVPNRKTPVKRTFFAFSTPAKNRWRSQYDSPVPSLWCHLGIVRCLRRSVG
ncbi:hypothetical protein TBK1r_42940 [Stieleria magnilauensis]|uniref:Uncharacterized protein n=1 Tax=Stieleria magnilauensis TaxID=2527963 RepID=A0ABX5XWI9_9BACT|nr:hypothetical protein TBK1r_42940 [Planctomycetes bacterium TBK1r]